MNKNNVKCICVWDSEEVSLPRIKTLALLTVLAD